MDGIIEVDACVRLCPVEEKDAERIFAAIDSFRSDLRRFLPFVDTTFDKEDSLKYVRLVREMGEKVFVVECEGEFCGLAGFRDTDVVASRTEIGYWLTPPFRGRGIMRSCVSQLVDYAFDMLGVNRVIIRCAVDNHRSARVASSLGFTFTGIQPRGELLASGWTDLQVWQCCKENRNAATVH